MWSAGARRADYLRTLRRVPWVFGDPLVQVTRIVETYGPDTIERACEQVLPVGATDGVGRLQRILEAGLHREPLPWEADRPVSDAAHDFCRPLAAAFYRILASLYGRVSTIVTSK